jgi:hypothetical protein
MRRLALCLAAICIATACGPDGSSTPGVVHAAPGEGWFVDVTAEVGLDFFHETGATGSLHLPEIVGSGAALLDYDGDGDLDVYLVSGSFDLAPDPAVSRPVNRLFRQEEDGTFVDVTTESGLGDAGYGIGAAVGDIDNDGDVDVYVSNFGPDRLYSNRGDGSFSDVTAAAGIRVDGFSCSAVFCDYDLDGFLDLYVTRYVRYDPDQQCSNSSGRRDYCSPKAFNPVPDVLLHNNGDGTFSDVSDAAGISGVAGAGLGVVCEDLDEDGLPDFYAANDQYPNHLWINQGDGTFREQALLLGAAYNLEGRAEAGMGVVAADLDEDAHLDLFVTHLGGQTNTLYRYLGRGLFEDATGVSGLAQSSLPSTGFGTVAFDAELDGDLDLLVANGRVFRGVPSPATTVPEPWNHFAEPNQFLLNRGGGHYVPMPDLGSAFVGPVEVSRSLAMGDVDGDGDVDVLLGNTQSTARLYRNEAPRAGHWLIVRALDSRLHRDAIGARLSLAIGGRRITRTVTRGFSYLSSSDPRPHFGLGPASEVGPIEVRWPDGLVESFNVPEVDRVWTLVRGEGTKLP